MAKMQCYCGILCDSQPEIDEHQSKRHIAESEAINARTGQIEALHYERRTGKDYDYHECIILHFVDSAGNLCQVDWGKGGLRDIDRANAARMVQCWNEHDALVAEVKRLKAKLTKEKK